MAYGYRRRWRGGSRRTPKRSYYWDHINPAVADLPTVGLTSATLSDAAMTSIRRYTSGGDLLLHRHICRTHVRIVHGTGGGAPSTNLVLRVCVGLGIFDDRTTLNGEATNVAMGSGTGPASDADNSTWFVRCCVDIPIGLGSSTSWAGNHAYPFNMPGYSQGMLNRWYRSATQVDWTWDCHIDSRVKRKLEGIETDWITVALEADTNGASIVAGNTIDVYMNQWDSRHVMSLR